MGWQYIRKIKNDLGEYTFCVPTIDLTANPPSAARYTYSSYRQSGSEETSSADFVAIRSMLTSLITDASANGAYNGAVDGSVDTFVYGKSGGTGVRVKATRSDVNPNIYSFAQACVRYLSFTSYNNILTQSGNTGHAGNYYYPFAGFCLSYNDETQEIYLGFVFGNMNWYNADHNPRYYDSASIYIDWGYTNGNLYSIFSSSLPSGGGGDPYEEGGTSTTTPTSGGDFDTESEEVETPALPTLSAINAGLMQLFIIDETGLATFANDVLSNSNILTYLKNWFASPIEAIACLNYMPYTPANNNAYYSLKWASETVAIHAHIPSSQYEEIDCGTLDLTEFYGSCLDYSPYTSVQLVLPFAGSVDIDPDEFNTKSIGVVYHIDNFTGSGLVIVSDGDRVLMQVPCSVANPIPFTSSDYSTVLSSIANIVVSGVAAIGAVYTGGASVGAATAIAGGFAASAAGNVMSAKVHINHGGSMGMGTGMFGVQNPYLVIKRPRQCLPEGNNKYQGYPSFVTLNLGDLSGFTKVAEIHLDDIPLTDAEKRELETILKGGVFF